MPAFDGAQFRLAGDGRKLAGRRLRVSQVFPELGAAHRIEPFDIPPDWQRFSKALADDSEVLMVFVGPHTYISPDWYANEDLVPTWNYAVVHAYGQPRTMDDAELRRQIDDLSASRETLLPKTPWTTDKMPPDLVEKMCKAIVGFDLAITQLQDKWKFNQNRSAGDRAGVVAALEELGGESNLAVATTMGSLE